MGDTIKVVAAGFVAVALVTAFGLHADQLKSLPQPTGQAISNVFGTAEKG